MRPTVNGGFLRYSAAHTSTTGLTFSRAFEGRAFFKEVPGDISVIFSESPIANIDAGVRPWLGRERSHVPWQSNLRGTRD